MKRKLLHTVEGLRDLHPHATGEKTVIENNLVNVFRHYGYEQVETPTFEYYENYHYKRGTQDARHLYKFFNREGEILALRPDVTPSIARFTATFYNHQNSPRRFCYVGNVFINSENYQGKPREFTQAGVECIGLGNEEADAEIIAMAVSSLQAAGLREFQIDIGHADFFNGLAEEAGLDESIQEEVRLLIDEKNFIGLENLLKDLKIDENIRVALTALPTLFGQIEVLDRARSLTTNAKALEAINRIEKVYEILKEYEADQYISFELGMVSQLQYYTGMIFKGYTFGTGISIVDGGRYDALLSTYEYDAPAVGFAIRVDEVVSALNRQGITIEVPNIDTLMIYQKPYRAQAIRLAETLRRQGMTLELGINGKTIEESIAYGKEKRIGGMMHLIDRDTIELINLSSGEKQKVRVSQLLEGGL